MLQNKKKSFQLNNTTTLLLFVLNILFIGYFTFLAIYNRLSQDDFLFMKAIENSGCFSFVKGAFLSQSGRFIGYFYNSILYSFIIKTGSIIYIPIFTWIIIFLMFRFVLTNFLTSSSFLSFNLSALFLNLFIITNFEFTAFYWICATFYYVQPVLMLALFALVNQDKVSKFQYEGLILFAVLISGSSEVFIPFCLLFLLINLLYYYIKHNKDLSLMILDNKVRRIIVSMVIIFIGFVIVIIAPGNYNRATEAIFHQPQSFAEFLKISVQSFVLFIYLLAFKFPYYIILILISFIVGFQNRLNFGSKINLKRFLLYSWLGYLIFIGLSVLPTAYLMSGFGFQRIYTSTIFFSILFFVLQGFVFGLKTNFVVKVDVMKRLIYINLLILIAVMIVNIYMDIPNARKYSQSDKERTEFLLDLKKQNHKGLVKLSPLFIPYTYNLKYILLKEKQPMLYYLNEIEMDTAAYSNLCIKSYYELEFPICLK